MQKMMQGTKRGYRWIAKGAWGNTQLGLTGKWESDLLDIALITRGENDVQPIE